MTGFGSAEGEVGGASVSVEIRSVNHRFFNPSIKLPNELGKWEADVRDALRKGVARGHVTLFARLERGEASASRIDGAQVAAYVEQLRALEAQLGVPLMSDVSAVLRLPNVIAASGDDAAGTAAELVAIVDQAVAALDRMRTAEGARLATYLEERLSIIEGAVNRISDRAPQRLGEQRDRLRAAIKELAEGVAVDDQRIAQEVAILADRLDVAEEMSRFHSHFAAFRATLASASSEGVGKRLGFLLQELLREANTTGSKANDAVMLHEVILIKEELERIREQSENLE
ncbi:MAG TPA: YicC/YloC family endoribonuclease [Gemmatimonadaceae bacterium]|nr:YicC/YloC family endoribonuclease [Gemmatimonadaceae bacterium]